MRDDGRGSCFSRLSSSRPAPAPPTLGPALGRDSRPAPDTLRVTCTQGTGIDVATEQVPTSVTFVVMHRQHSEYTYGGVQPSPDGGWATWVDGTCDPDRLPSAS
jgi:hypothetical protein